jgi:hypothetical protein
MVTHTGAADGAGRIRPLNAPVPMEVEADEHGWPKHIKLGRQWAAVAAVQDRWRLDDEWWREEPLSRQYFEIVLASGARYTLFVDLQSGDWYRQR